MSGNKELILREIEELRSNMNKIKEGRSYSDPEVVTSSQKLDVVLNKYHEMLVKDFLKG
ncbi:MAG: aspartyl-phosphate phosphatase Spo0E family protein [Desulfosporosinus sp.]|nr:aspartyl-phosphate phosphatase Spo0E family protein [Desulfosporosinus sp.]